MTDINLQQDNHQDKVNNKMLKYVESISTIALSNRSQIRDLQKTVKYYYSKSKAATIALAVSVPDLLPTRAV